MPPRFPPFEKERPMVTRDDVDRECAPLGGIFVFYFIALVLVGALGYYIGYRAGERQLWRQYRPLHAPVPTPSWDVQRPLTPEDILTPPSQAVPKLPPHAFPQQGDPVPDLQGPTTPHERVFPPQPTPPKLKQLEWRARGIEVPFDVLERQYHARVKQREEESDAARAAYVRQRRDEGYEGTIRFGR